MGAFIRGLPDIVDVEASGFGPDGYPIEIGVALGNGQKYCSLINPAPDWDFWDAGAEAVHHITRDILAQHGKPLAVIAADLNALLENRTVYTDGWVVDKPWIDKLFYRSGMQARFSVSALEMILTDEQMIAWHDTKDRITSSSDLQRHRASNDALIIQQTWAETRQMQ